MEWHYPMSSVHLAWDAHVPHNTADAASVYENSLTFAPHPVELIEESLVVPKFAELPLACLIFLEGPVRGRGDYEMNRFVSYPREHPGIPEPKEVFRSVEWRWPRGLAEVSVRAQ